MSHSLEKEFIVLVQQNKGIIHKVVNANCSDEYAKEDLFQDIVMNAWLSFPSFKRECKFSTWLYRVAENISCSYFKKIKNTIKGVSMNNIFYEIADSIDFAERIGSHVDYDYYISKLKDGEVDLILLYAEGNSYEQMEAITGLDKQLLRMRVSRIKQRLKLCQK